MRKITFITGNKGKLHSANKHLKPFGFQVVGQDLNLMEPQLDSIAEIAQHKAQQAYDLTREPLTVLDAGLVIPALGGFPGPYTKYCCDATLKAEGMLGLINGLPLPLRKGYFYHHLCYVDAKGNIHNFSDKYHGTFAEKVVKEGNPNVWSELAYIFIPQGASKPLIEIADDKYPDYEESAREGIAAWPQLANFLTQQA